MTNSRRVLIFFVSFICVIYLYGILHQVVYQSTLKDITSVSIDKASFFDVTNSEKNIMNRELSVDEDTTIKYQYNFSKSALDNLELSPHANENIYLMIEKPDAQYFEVQLNDINIGSFGDEHGMSNIWNGTFYVMFNENILKDENKLTISMNSDYMTGVAGQILFLGYDEYSMISSVTNYNSNLIRTASNIAFVIAAIIGLMIIAWYKSLYNIKVYLYFFISILFIGISIYDYKVSQSIALDYLIFKKIIVLSYHISVTCAALAIAHLLNAKYKFNVGMISLVLIAVQIVRVDNMIHWRDSYQLINVFLILTIIQLLVTLIYYRKRAASSAFVLIVAFLFASVSVIKLVYITSTSQESSMLIDMPILIIMYAAVVLFVFYIEMTQMVSDQDMDIEKSLSLNGSFTIDKNLNVVGQYSNTCDAIFDELIMGRPIKNLLFQEEYEFNEDILKSVFDPKYDFVEGFLDLLPTEACINGRDYVIGYRVKERIERLLKITLSDVTRSKVLEEALQEQKDLQRFFINALKSKQELSYFINRTRRFISTVRHEGFTYENQIELHTLKGNMGQFGFVSFERTVHHVETALTEDYEQDALIDELENSLQEAIQLLEKHIGKTCFNNSYLEYSIRKSDIMALEENYLKSECVDENFLKQIRALRLIDLKFMLSRYNNYVAQLAAELEKSVLPLDVEGDPIMVQPDKAEPFIMSLVAIFRNSLTHGIETAENRVMNGKDSFASIKCHLNDLGDHVEIVIEDDGEGLDFEKIKQRAIDRKLVSESDQLTEESMYQLVLNSRLSSKNEADRISGRGIGLTAVHDSVVELGGDVSLKSTTGMGTSITMSIPYRSFTD